jgi:hypothetical protein
LVRFELDNSPTLAWPHARLKRDRTMSDDYEVLQLQLSQWGLNVAQGNYEKRLQILLANCRDRRDWTMFNKVLILYGYYLLKPGVAVAFAGRREALRDLIVLANGREEISAAASWVLGRLYTARSSIAWNLARKARLLHAAVRLFSKITSNLFFHSPILLPGVHSECAPDDFYDDPATSVSEPRVIRIRPPLRYISNVHSSLADVRALQANNSHSTTTIKRDLCGAMYYGELSRCRRENEFPLANFNAQMTKPILDAIWHYRFRKKTCVSSTIERICYLRDDATQLYQDQILSPQKYAEFYAVLSGALTLTSAGNRRELAKEDWSNATGELLKLKNGNADFLTIDPVHRLTASADDVNKHRRVVLASVIEATFGTTAKGKNLYFDSISLTEQVLKMSKREWPKVFLSYSSKDKQFVNFLGKFLCDNRIKTWVAEGELNSGDEMLTKLADATLDADFVVAIISKHSIRSNWVKFEILASMTDEISNGKTKVLPVLKDDTSIPSILRSKLYADFSVRSRRKHEKQKLVRTIHKLHIENQDSK